MAVRMYWGVFYTSPSDHAVIGATYLRHEKYHRDVAGPNGASERLAYREQLSVLNKFGPGAFMNKNVYNPFHGTLEMATKTGRMR